MADTSNPTDPLNSNPQQQPSPNYSATDPSAPPTMGPVAPPSHTGLPYPPDRPPQYGEVFQEKPPGGVPPVAGQAYMMPGPAPVPGPGTVNYQAGQATIVATPMMLSAFPAMVTCPNCHQNVTTNVVYVNGTMTWVLVVLLLLVGFYLCCCLIPFCLDGCKDAVHTCPSCNYTVGIYRRM